jgi:NO-binding membrane sensor protein with MHYT domain
LAAAVCLVSTYACIGLMRHAQQARGRMRLVWNGVSALAVGLGIWGTHFIAMLAFRPGIPLAYNVPLTALSLLIAILVCGGGISSIMSVCLNFWVSVKASAWLVSVLPKFFSEPLARLARIHTKCRVAPLN